jgi:hypothetical protein
MLLDVKGVANRATKVTFAKKEATIKERTRTANAGHTENKILLTGF